MVARSKFTRDGKTYYTVGATAKALKTNTMKVKQLMGSGELDWLNHRVNGTLYITETSILAYQRKLVEHKRAAYAAKKA